MSRIDEIRARLEAAWCFDPDADQGGIMVNSTLDVVSYGEGTGTSRLDWFGEKDVINDSE